MTSTRFVRKSGLWQSLIVSHTPPPATSTIAHGSEIPAAFTAGLIGLKAGVGLTNVGNGWAPQANTTYENLLIPKAHTITVPGVTFVNCHFVNNGQYRILENWQTVSNASVTTLVNCHIDGNGWADAGIFGQNFRLERCTFADTLKDMHVTNNIVVIECLMRDHIIPPDGAHCECVFMGSGSDRTFLRCFMTYEPDVAVSSAISAYNQPDCYGFLLEDCYVSGGGYAVYGGGTTNTADVKIRGNIFGRDMGRFSGLYGPMDFTGMNTPGWEFSGNTWGARGADWVTGDPEEGDAVATW